VAPGRLGVRLPPSFENYLLGLLAKQPEDRPTAQEVTDWFRAGSWQGRPEPLPEPVPVAPAPTPAPHFQTSPEIRTTSTTYQLPSSGRAARRGAARRGGVLEAARRRPRIIGAVAAAALFIASLLIGMAWFAPDDSAATAPTGAPSPSASAH
jgi:serine/threonine-protein kinase